MVEVALKRMTAMGGKRSLTHRAIEADTLGMRLPLTLATLLMFVCAQPVTAQPMSDVEARRDIEEIQASHIQANVPDDTAFSRLLQRDLDAYFADRGFRSPAVSFELLRRAATQSGVAYPKFYLWVRVRSVDGRFTSGAVRVAAVERQRFDVTDFLSASEIKADPSRVGSIFPRALVPGIIDRAAL